MPFGVTVGVHISSAVRVAGKQLVGCRARNVIQVAGPDQFAAQRRHAFRDENAVRGRDDGSERCSGCRVEFGRRYGKVIEEVTIQRVGKRLKRLPRAVYFQRQGGGNTRRIGRALVNLYAFLIRLQQVEAAGRIKDGAARAAVPRELRIRRRCYRCAVICRGKDSS